MNRPGALVISLDFELLWGVRDFAVPGHRYQRNVIGARSVIPRLLELFQEFGIAATWATVGLLFAKSDDEAREFRPQILPRYVNRMLDPYSELVGRDEREDPLHYGWTLIDAISKVPLQAIGSHSYGHFYCSEAGASTTAFDADIKSAVAIAAARGFQVKSFVFPRNQVEPAYLEVLRKQGIHIYRGAESEVWRFGLDACSHRISRYLRYADSHFPLSSGRTYGWDEIYTNGMYNVRGSMFLRGLHTCSPAISAARFSRIDRLIREAATNGRIVHIWWHPHNFGRCLEANFTLLRQILSRFAIHRAQEGMLSLNMEMVAEALARTRPSVADGRD